MAIKYLAGNRIQGTSAERTAYYSASGAITAGAGWKEIKRTTISGSSTQSLEVSGITNKRYYMIINGSHPASGTNNQLMRLGTGGGAVDSGSNYTRRDERNNEWDGDGSGEPATSYMLNGGGTYDDDFFSIGFLANKSGDHKLAFHHSMYSGNSGAGSGSGSANAPLRGQSHGKWTNTGVVDRISYYNSGSGNVGDGSELIILGYDPTDTHTDNFWEELVNVDLSGGDASSLSSGTFTAKKYLWLQYYVPSGSGKEPRIRFNGDTGSNYASRWEINTSGEGSSTAYGGRNSVQGAGGAGAKFCNMFIKNWTTREKLVNSTLIDAGSAGDASHSVNEGRREQVSKWVNSNQITSIELGNDGGSGNLGVKTFLRVWGAN